MSRRRSRGCKGYLASTKEEQLKIGALGVVYGEPGIDLETFRNSIELSAVLKKLKGLTKS